MVCRVFFGYDTFTTRVTVDDYATGVTTETVYDGEVSDENISSITLTDETTTT